MIKVVSWNIGGKYQPLQELREMDADVALLQEVRPRMRKDLTDAGRGVEVTPHDFWEPWPNNPRGRWPLVVKLSDRVRVEWFKQTIPLRWIEADQIAVSGIGTVAAAKVIPVADGVEPFIAVSMYARWLQPHPTVGKPGWIYPDASAHNIISDLSVFIGSYDSSTHRILAAGDLNVAFFASGSGFNDRAQTIVDRMNVLGLEYVGPEHPNGRRAEPNPDHLPEDTKNVPTHYTRTRTPASAHVQLDHVFASRGFHESVRTKALNGVDEWGSSDHCRIVIEVGD